MSEHLDIFDARRGDQFSEATCRDCEHYLPGCPCEAEAHILAQLITDIFESNPDAEIPGLRIMPKGDDKANRCIGFFPSFEYREDLAAQDRDAELTRREDLSRLAAMGRIGADFGRALNLVKGA